jgi:uncharacterized small protein (DUF1192 family)
MAEMPITRASLTDSVIRSTILPMDLDDILPKRPDDPLVALTRQDLDPFSVEELTQRIAVLEAEIARAKAKIERAVNHRANAEGLFKR